MVLEMDQRNFVLAEISKLIETNDAQITQLNTSWDNASESFLVTIKINKFEISDIVATFQRYEYEVKYYFGEELYENELKDNYDHLCELPEYLIALVFFVNSKTSFRKRRMTTCLLQGRNIDWL